MVKEVVKLKMSSSSSRHIGNQMGMASLKPGMARARICQSKLYPLLEPVCTTVTNAKTWELVLERSCGRTSSRTRAMALYRRIPRPGGHSALYPILMLIQSKGMTGRR
jgi:hypothetical protein